MNFKKLFKREERRVYRHRGLVLVHVPMSLEQWALAEQILLETNRDGKSISAMLADGKLLSVLLVEDNREFHSDQVERLSEKLKSFPAEWSMEVMRDFFQWNPLCSGTSVNFGMMTNLIPGMKPGKDSILDAVTAV